MSGSALTIRPKKGLRITRAAGPYLVSALAPPAVPPVAAIRGADGATGAAGGATQQAIAGQAISALRVLRLGAAGKALYADAALAADRTGLIGISAVAAANGNPVDYVAAGPMSDGAWTWTPQAAIYCGANGALTQAVPVSPAAAFSAQVAFAATATAIFVKIERTIKL